jgi:hypothetical protein
VNKYRSTAYSKSPPLSAEKVNKSAMKEKIIPLASDDYLEYIHQSGPIGG